MEKASQPRFLPAGDTALVVEFGNSISETLSNRVLALKAALELAKLPGIIETIPTFRSLLISYDPLITSGDALEIAIQTLPSNDEAAKRRYRLWRLPVCYESDFAPDLDEVAALTGLSALDVVALHSGMQFHVYMIGFAPGFPYMGDLPQELRIPRRPDPRVRVPAGSVAIATAMTAIYPVESPGGWRLIGRCPIRLFDPAWLRPALLSPGDAVRFHAVTSADFEAIGADARADRYKARYEEIIE